MKKAILYEKRDKNIIQCTCCQHRCMILEGKSGKCGVRQNIKGDLFLRVYGKAIAVHVDPIEKKPFFHFMPGSDVFSFGTIGCNFRCSYCQNWDISQVIEQVKQKYANNPDETELIIGDLVDEGQDLPPQKIVEYCRENKYPIIAYTYNEPTIFAEYAGDTAKLAKKYGIKNVFVTNGYESEECLNYMQNWCDAMNIDIKSYSEEFYQKVCGGVKLQGVLDTVKKAWEKGIWVECTTLIIPGLNDSDAELESIANFIVGVSDNIPWHVTAFHPDFKMDNIQSTPASTLERAWKIGKDAGLKFVYTGNMLGLEHEDTFCPKCHEKLIDRLGLSTIESKIKIKDEKAFCSKCDENIPGIWK